MTDNTTPRPWRVATNPGGPGDQPAFPSVVDSSGNPHGMDIVCMPLGDSETVKANAELIVLAVNSHDELCGTLQEVQDFLEGYIDVVDGDDGMPKANAAMQLNSAIEAVLRKAGAA